MPSSKAKAKLLIPASPDWFNFLPPLPTTSVPVVSQSASQIANLLDHASSLHASELTTFSALPDATGSSASDRAFLRNILSGGTLSDRLSALTLMVQGAPLHNVRALEALKDLTERGRGGVSTSQDGEKGKGKATGREDRLKAARAIMDWWVGGGAPNRKLRYFRDQPLLHPDVTDQHLVIWYFEDWLKKYFFSYLQILEVFSLDPLPYVRMQSLALIATLLRSHPEQEQNLLRLLVNKFGDTESSICARTSYYLLHILQEHPAMKTIIIQETTALIMQPTPPIGPSTAFHSQKNKHIRFSDNSKSTPQREKNVWHAHAQYYAAITFNQIVLSTSAADRAAARKLIDVYFQLFREVVGERKPDPADADGDATSTKEKSKDKGKEQILKKRGPQKRKGKEVRGAAGFAEVQDADAKLLGAILTGISRSLPYAQFGRGDEEFGKHMDTLFLLVHTSTFNISLRALTLIQQIAASFSASSPIVPRFYRALYASLLDPRLHTARNQAFFLNLLFKSLKADSNQARVMAFVKRFCQTLVNGFGGSEFVAGGLWLLGELFDVSPGLRALIDRAPPHEAESEEYDPYKREPQYAHAQSSALWELTTLVHHAHPTIALLAHQLLSHEPLTSSPDLTLYTLTHFLDRFVYKNPKKTGARGTSAMQPSTAGGAGGVSRVRADVQETPLNVDGWWRRGEGGVAADQVFFQRYFAQKHGKEQVKAAKVDKRKANHHDSDTGTDGAIEDGSGDEDSDPEEAAIWKAMNASMQKVEDDEDVDDHDDIDDDDDDSGVDYSMQDSESDKHALSDTDTEEDEEGPSDAEDDINVDWEFNGIGFSDVDDSAGSDTQACVSPALSGGKARKRKGLGDEDDRTRKKKLRALPTFASYEDYARMIEDGPEENI